MRTTEAGQCNELCVINLKNYSAHLPLREGIKQQREYFLGHKQTMVSSLLLFNYTKCKSPLKGIRYHSKGNIIHQATYCRGT